MNCAKCGRENPDMGEFCIHCGMHAIEEDAAQSVTPDHNLQNRDSIPEPGMLQYHEEPFYTEWTGYTRRISQEQWRRAVMVATVAVTALVLSLVILAFVFENLYFRIFVVGVSIILAILVGVGWLKLRSIKNWLYGKSPGHK